MSTSFSVAEILAWLEARIAQRVRCQSFRLGLSLEPAGAGVGAPGLLGGGAWCFHEL
jgi:hypothetical protein